MSVLASELRDENFLDLRAMWNRVASRRWWVAASVVAFAIATTVVAFATTPVYRASAILMPASVDANNLGGSLDSTLGALGGLAGLANITLGSRESGTEEALAVLRSREFTEKFIRDKQLMPRLFPSKWDSVNGKWKVSPDDQPTFAKSYKLFNKKIRSVTRDKKTGLVMISINWADPQEAADWANELVNRLNIEMRSRAINNAEAALGFLEKELATTSTIDTREAIGRLTESQIKQRMLANVTQEYALRFVDKAMPPDADDPVRPRKLLMIASGLMLGLAFGIGCAIVFGGASGSQNRQRAA